MGTCDERPEKPRRRGHPDRVRRWTEGISRGNPRDLPSCRCAGLRRTPDQAHADVHLAQGQEAIRRGPAIRIHRVQRGASLVRASRDGRTLAAVRVIPADMGAPMGGSCAVLRIS